MSNISIHSVFHNRVLCRLIFVHVSDIHRQWCKNNEVPDDDNIQFERAIPLPRTIKGSKLQANGNLIEMIRFNHSSLFIQTFDNNVVDRHNLNFHYLFSSAAHYNNITVFKHLIKYVNDNNNKFSSGIKMILVQDSNTLQELCRHGNVDMLQDFLALSPYCELPGEILDRLPVAVDAGNEQFVRLFLKRFIPIERSYKHRVSVAKFRSRCGVSIGMLKILHEEAKLLNNHTALLNQVLYHSTKNNSMDSVQYIMDNIRAPLRLDRSLNQVITKSLVRCAKVGNIAMFEAIINADILSHYPLRHFIKEILYPALDHGQESFIKHLVINHPFKNHYFKSWFKCIDSSNNNNQSQSIEFCVANLDKIKLSMIVSMAIRLDDNSSAEKLLYYQEFNGNLFRKMSKSMAELITGPRPHGKNPYVFDVSSILHMIEAIGQSRSTITPDMVCQYIENCYIITNNEYDQEDEVDKPCRLMWAAAAHSAKLMQLLHTRYKLDYDAGSLEVALEKRCRETISLLFQQDVHNYNIGNQRIINGLHSLMAKGSLEDVVYVLDQLTWVSYDWPEILVSALLNDDIKVFEYTIKMFTIDQLDDTLLSTVVDLVLRRDWLHIFKMLVQRCDDEEDVSFSNRVMAIAHSYNLSKLARSNSYQSLEYLFNNFPTPTTMSQQLSSCHSIMYHAYQSVTTRVIKLCTDKINAINQSIN
ncbi:LOW QUALITY PROTEIN: hypothetical protein SAMD00019534_100730, partial [Acytostelium subglobosum LB1]|uniref:hypothetical protein n=1 Tax=Acytostelium subglobosum LB1 TaxID=1410327 RepID=UPI000644EE78